MKPFSVIAAVASSCWGIGKDGQLPWKISADMKFFKKLTSSVVDKNKKNVVIMGRKTYESLSKPLVGRLNVILSRNPSIKDILGIPDSVMICDSFMTAMKRLSSSDYENIIEEIFVIGGGVVYGEAIKSRFCSKIYLTEIDDDCLTVESMDTFFPCISETRYRLTYRSERQKEENRNVSFCFTEYDAISEEPR